MIRRIRQGAPCLAGVFGRGLGCLCWAALLTLCCACGDDQGGEPGYVRACQTSVSAVLTCPGGFTSDNGTRLADVPAALQTAATNACNRLVACGILAAERRIGRNRETHNLDLRWCVDRLRAPGATTNPCGGGVFSDANAESTARCIDNVPCRALGLDLSEKVKTGASAPSGDRYTCNDGTTNVRSATICDQGLLRY